MATRKWGSETIVHANLLGDQYGSKVAALAGGGFVVVWQDDGSGVKAIMAQIYDALGNRAGGELTIASNVGIDFELPDVTGLADGTFYITATQLVGTDNFIVGSVWDASGALVRSQHVVFAFGLDSNAQVAELGTGSVVAWTDPAQFNNNILFRIFDAAGNGGALLTANTSTQKFLATPDIASAPDGQTIAIVWTDPDSFLIRGRLFNGAGVGITPEFAVDQFAGVEMYEPTVAWLNQAEFAVTWREHHPASGGGNQILVRIFDSQNATPIPLTDNILVNSTTFGTQQKPAITALPTGGFVVSWEDLSQTGGDTSGSAIRLQAFDGAGGKIGGEYLVNTTTSFGQFESSVSALADGRVVVTWTDQSSGFRDVRMQIIDPRDGVVTGSANADTLYGNASVNDEISGLDGNDTLIGMNGDDQLFGGAGNDTANGGRGDDTDYGGAGNDVLLGGSGDDDLFGEDGNDDLRGGLGADAMDGGAGKDAASYVLAKSAVIVALDGTLVATGEAAGDSFTRIEDLTGSNLVAEGDTLKGNAAANAISGLAGDDILLGGGGSDVLAGGRGADTVTGGAGNDRFSYAALTEVGDVITDFSSLAVGNNDVFQFRGSAFGGLGAGALLATQFQSSASDTAGTAGVRFFYETDTGILRFDADGSGGVSAAVIIATLQPGATMAIADIAIL